MEAGDCDRPPMSHITCASLGLGLNENLTQQFNIMPFCWNMNAVDST